MILQNNDNKDISKIMKCFTSELIEILRGSTNMRDIGIRGDCVYAIYTTPSQQDLHNLYLRACCCNTYIKMLNKLLLKYALPNFKVGIGLGASETLVIKAGRKDVGINDKVWIGDSVIDASNFAPIANKCGFGDIVMSEVFYNNLSNIEDNVKIFFDKKYSE